MSETLSEKTSGAAAPATASTGSSIDDATYSAMLAVLTELTDHTHIFYDDYTTACDCNCNCNCTRGTV